MKKEALRRAIEFAVILMSLMLYFTIVVFIGSNYTNTDDEGLTFVLFSTIPISLIVIYFKLRNKVKTIKQNFFGVFNKNN